jgi:hypothetical protein
MMKKIKKYDELSVIFKERKEKTDERDYQRLLPKMIRIQNR